MQPFTKKLVIFIFLCLPSISLFGQILSPKPVDSVLFSKLKGKYNYIIANDLGRNGYYDQKPVAEMMGEVASLTRAKFIAALGDVHHFMGVESVHDPLWLTNFELVYSHPALMIPWHPVLGNHEYIGNTNAVLDYSKISRRWQMPSLYYAKEVLISDSTKALLVFINTTPLIDTYWKKNGYPDVKDEAKDVQLNWLDSILNASNAKWKIVMGHHPIYASTSKSIQEQLDMRKWVQPIIEKHHTDVYFCGHIHNFQHHKIDSSQIDYFVNTSASLSREVKMMDGIIFKSNEAGFAVCTIEKNQLYISLVNKYGKIIYQYIRK